MTKLLARCKAWIIFCTMTERKTTKDDTPHNWIDGFIHSVRCPFVLDRAQECDCHPSNISKAMRGADVQRVFAPLPPEEVAFLRYVPRSGYEEKE